MTEAAWTRPSPWCPQPQYWHAGDDQVTETEVTELVAGFVRALQPELVIETGTYTGQTAEAIGRALASNGHGALFTVETDRARATAARARVAGLPVVVVHGDSLTQIPRLLTGGRAGFAWLDSAPGIRGKELTALAPYLEPGAVIGIHDTRPGRPPALAAVKADGFAVITLRTPRGVTFMQRRDRS